MSAATSSSRAAPPAAPLEHQLAVFLFTDIVGSSTLKAERGDMAYATQIAQRHNALFRALVARYPDAQEISYTGDGFLLMCGSVVSAVEIALLFHAALRAEPWEGRGPQVRIGIHVGQTVIMAKEADDRPVIASSAADLCSRVMSLAAGGQTLLTRHAFDDARQYVRAHPVLGPGQPAPELAWAAHGPYLCVGRLDPIEVFEVGAAGIAPLAPPADAEKARRMIRPGEEETLGWRPAHGVEIPGRPGWRLQERLGEGGFGEVWRAEHERMRQQRVFKFCFDDERLRSFKRELTLFRLIREALGERADIARLYDVKLDAPPFFLESEFATRGNLAHWFEAQGGALAVPLPRRLDLMARVADAVGAAHSAGILHKDIKPQNVLMQTRDGEDFPQLTDFGIGALVNAEALAAHEITAAGFTVNTLPGSTSGTRLYAPPEQLTGKPFTVQGDVYSMGVMLYQLVIGDLGRALAPGWERDVEDPLLRADIADCVDGDPHRRCASAAELATRLRTLDQRREQLGRAAEQARLAQELAEEKERAEAARRRLRQTRLVAAVVTVLALAALVAGGWARRAQLRAEHAEVIASAERRQADTNRELALAAQQEAERKTAAAQEERQRAVAAKKAADDLIYYLQHDLHDRLGRIGKLDLMTGVNDRIREHQKKFPVEAGDAETERQRAVTLSQNGDLLYNRGQLDQAMASYREGLAIHERMLVQDPANLKPLRGSVSAQVKIGDVLRAQGRTREALEQYRAALALNDQLIAQQPQAIDPQYDRAMVEQKLGDVFRDLRQVDAALAAYRESAAIRERGLQRQPGNPEWPRQLSFSYFLLGELLREQGDPEGALVQFRAALELRRKLVEAEPGNAVWQSDLSYCHIRIGDVLFDRQQFAEALTAFEESLATRERLAQQDPDNAPWVRDLGGSLYRVGNAARQLRDWPKSLRAYRRAMDIAGPWLSKPQAEVAWTNIFATAAGNTWEIVREVPAALAVVDRATARGDLQTALEAVRQLKSVGRLVPPLDRTLAWLEELATALGK